MKLVLCASAYPPHIRGGGEVSTALLARGLTDLGVDTTVVTFHDEGQPSRQRHNGVDVLRLPSPGPYWSLRSDSASPSAKVRWHLSQAFRHCPPRMVTDAIKRLKPDLIHSSTIEDFGVGLWRWAKKSRLKTVHTLRSYCLLHRGATLYDARKDRELGPDWLSVGKRRASQSLDGVIGISNSILQRHRENRFFVNADSQVISNPVLCQPPEGSTRVLSSDVSEPHEGPLKIGVLGRVAAEKGIGPFLDCLRNIDNARWTLDIAGKGSNQEVAKLKERSRGMSVRFLGWCDQQAFLGGIELLVVPSRWQEPFGRIVIEAFASGVPVVCLRRGGLPELMVEGETGWVMNDWNVEQLSNALRNSRRLSRARIRTHATPFAVPKIAAAHVRFYEQLLGKSSSTRRDNRARRRSTNFDRRCENSHRGPVQRMESREKANV